MSDRDRTLAPESGPIRDFQAPSVIAESLDNGLKIKVARSPQVPVVTVSLVLDAGEDLLGKRKLLTVQSIKKGISKDIQLKQFYFR